MIKKAGASLRMLSLAEITGHPYEEMHGHLLHTCPIHPIGRNGSTNGVTVRDGLRRIATDCDDPQTTQINRLKKCTKKKRYNGRDSIVDMSRTEKTVTGRRDP